MTPCRTLSYTSANALCMSRLERRLSVEKSCMVNRNLLSECMSYGVSQSVLKTVLVRIQVPFRPTNLFCVLYAFHFSKAATQCYKTPSLCRILNPMAFSAPLCMRWTPNTQHHTDLERVTSLPYLKCKPQSQLVLLLNHFNVDLRG